MPHENELDLLGLLDDLSFEPGEMVFPKFGKVIVDDDPIATARKAFKSMEDLYYISTDRLHALLQSQSYVRASFDLGLIRLHDLGTWKYYMALYELAGGKFRDDWTFSHDDASHKVITTAQGGENPRLVVLFLIPLFRNR